MNFNANAAARQPGPARKAKRVSDTSALGVTPAAPFNPNPSYGPDTTQQFVPQGGPQPSGQFNNNNSNFYYQPQQVPQPQQQHQHQQIPVNNQYVGNQYGNYGVGPQGVPQPGVQQPHISQQQSQQAMPNFPPQFAMFQQPIVQDMAMQYGQKLADQGKDLVNKEFEKYVPVTKLKYYFAVDNKYVINKLRLLFFPFTHKDWSLKYDQDNPVQPRYDINAPDLYIPTMAYITYVVLAGFVLGMQDRFSPEQLGIQASSALAYSLFELVIYSIILYVANIPTTLKTLDLLAFSGYKYSVIVAVIMISILFQKSGYYISLIYCSLTLGFFLLRTLKAKVLTDTTAPNASVTYDAYGQASQSQQFEHTVGRKRKLYFLFLVAGLQPVLSFWLSMHLIPSTVVIDTASAAL